jgi:hypothetical protein
MEWSTLRSKKVISVGSSVRLAQVYFPFLVKPLAHVKRQRAFVPRRPGSPNAATFHPVGRNRIHLGPVRHHPSFADAESCSCCSVPMRRRRRCGSIPSVHRGRNRSGGPCRRLAFARLRSWPSSRVRCDVAAHCGFFLWNHRRAVGTR